MTATVVSLYQKLFPITPGFFDTVPYTLKNPSNDILTLKRETLNPLNDILTLQLPRLCGTAQVLYSQTTAFGGTSVYDPFR